MFVVGILSWWYGAGWQHRFRSLQERLARTIDYFSIDLLLKTLFAPFRQISAGRVNGPLGVKMQAFFDRLISRIIGAMIRMTIIVIGVFAILLQAIFGFVLACLWVFVPLLPILGVVMMLSGWVPWSL